MFLHICRAGSVDRCNQNAVMANGTNAITQRSKRKQNLGVTLTGSGRLRIAQDAVGVVDPDREDISVWNGENWTVHPS